jgi:hypothetical protein
MNPFPIGNVNNPPLNNINGSLVNTDNSHVQGIPFSSTSVPTGIHTLAPTGTNVQSAAGIYPCAQKGGKINRRKINKISRKYKMKGSKRTMKRRVRRMKSRVRSRYAKRDVRRASRRHMKGGSGSFQVPMRTPNYPGGYIQDQNNNGSISNVYSLGGKLTAADGALANPPPQQIVGNANVPDNLNHNTLNSYGNIGAGSGFPSRGWF